MSESSVVPVSAGVSAGVDGVSAAGDAGRVALSDTPDAILRRVPVAWLDAGREASGSVSCSCSSGISPATLALVGVGYKAQAQGAKLNLTVGYSHPVNKDMPAGITVATPVPTEIVIKGADRQRVGQVAAEIRAIRPPEPYKGKGIRYVDEKITIKETKKK